MKPPRRTLAMQPASRIHSAVVIGAGPAGLTAAYELTHLGVPTVVVDRDCRVGGLAQTVTYKGYRFDIGGHRFFTKVQLVQDLWRHVLGADLLKRPRLSRVYYSGRFFHYPLRAGDTLRNLGIVESASALFSYLWVKAFPIEPEVSFEDWISNRFGRRLFRIFFKSYTEKVWGLPCSEIAPQWAAQRIKGLSLKTAVLNMLLGERTSDRIKTLIGEFEYPRLGPGMMWDAFRERVERAGGTIALESRVIRLQHDGTRITGVVVARGSKEITYEPSHVISTMPIRELGAALDPPPPAHVLDAANRLKYRDFVTVALIVRQREVFPDNWIYVHDPSVRVGRIQNFKNWSPDMVPDQDMTCLGLEYFCSEGDDLWTLSDDQFIELAKRELRAIGIVGPELVVDGTVVRMRKAYPVYDSGCWDALKVMRRYLDGFSNLQLVGRNGTHMYNNQDHSMLTAILAVRNLLGEQHDLWAVNADDGYHEEVADIELASGAEGQVDWRVLNSTQPSVPTLIERRPPDAQV